MKNLQNKIEILEKSIKKLEKRNKKVEADKSWETSTFRKISVAVITYLIIVIIMYLLNFKDVFTNALIPTFGFLLSTLSIDILKKYYNTELNFEKINKKIMKNKTLILH